MTSSATEIASVKSFKVACANALQKERYFANQGGRKGAQLPATRAITGELVILLVLKLGIVAAWVWLMVYVILMAVGFIWRYRSGRWKSIELIDRETPVQPPRGGAEAMIVVE